MTLMNNLFVDFIYMIYFFPRFSNIITIQFYQTVCRTVHWINTIIVYKELSFNHSHGIQKFTFGGIIRGYAIKTFYTWFGFLVFQLFLRSVIFYVFFSDEYWLNIDIIVFSARSIFFLYLAVDVTREKNNSINIY